MPTKNPRFAVTGDSDTPIMVRALKERWVIGSDSRVFLEAIARCYHGQYEATMIETLSSIRLRLEEIERVLKETRGASAS